MRKTAAALFLLLATLATAQPLASQTRPRRVSESTEVGYSESQPRAAAGRARRTGDGPLREGERSGGRRRAGSLLRAGMTAAAIAASVRGWGSCTPSRGDLILGRIPRRVPGVDARR
jgi:hypothetical protein